LSQQLSSIQGKGSLGFFLSVEPYKPKISAFSGPAILWQVDVCKLPVFREGRGDVFRRNILGKIVDH